MEHTALHRYHNSQQRSPTSTVAAAPQQSVWFLSCCWRVLHFAHRFSLSYYCIEIVISTAHSLYCAVLNHIYKFVCLYRLNITCYETESVTKSFFWIVENTELINLLQTLVSVWICIRVQLQKQFVLYLLWRMLN